MKRCAGIITSCAPLKYMRVGAQTVLNIRGDRSGLSDYVSRKISLEVHTDISLAAAPWSVVCILCNAVWQNLSELHDHAQRRDQLRMHLRLQAIIPGCAQKAALAAHARHVSRLKKSREVQPLSRHQPCHHGLILQPRK